VQTTSNTSAYCLDTSASPPCKTSSLTLQKRIAQEVAFEIEHITGVVEGSQWLNPVVGAERVVCGGIARPVVRRFASCNQESSHRMIFVDAGLQPSVISMATDDLSLRKRTDMNCLRC
jgi:hypothetical protein